MKECNIQRIKGEKYYKSRQSYERQRGYFRMHFNQVREDKTSKYHKVCTKDFNSLIDEMQYYSNMEYICAGLNSFEREVVVVDCDDEDFGEKTYSLLKMAHLEPHFIKRKPNGHSQFFFFIQKFFIGEGVFSNTGYYEQDFVNEHWWWKWLTKHMNVLFNGDAGYTGYNCQNPFYEKGNVEAVRPLDKLYDVVFLINRINHFLANPVILEQVNNTIRQFYSERKTNQNKVKKELTKIHFLDEEMAEQLARESREELQRKLEEIYANREITNKEEVEELVNNIIRISEDSINKRIFVVCSQVCKSFWSRGFLHNKDYFDEIVATCMSNWLYQDNAVGYTTYELAQRIKNDVYEIQQKDLNHTMLWNKVGYTKLQRDISLSTRRNKMHEKQKRVIQLFEENQPVFKKKSLFYIMKFIKREYSNVYGESISLSSIRTYIIRQYKNVILYIKTHSNKIKCHYNLSYSVQHNNKLTKRKKRTTHKTSSFVLKILYKYKMKDMLQAT